MNILFSQYPVKFKLTSTGRLHISANNITALPLEIGANRKDLIDEILMDADLTIIGLHEAMLKTGKETDIFDGYEKIGNVLTVNTLTKKFIG